jgi:hypothetical protein
MSKRVRIKRDSGNILHILVAFRNACEARACRDVQSRDLLHHRIEVKQCVTVICTVYRVEGMLAFLLQCEPSLVRMHWSCSALCSHSVIKKAFEN